MPTLYSSSAGQAGFSIEPLEDRRMLALSVAVDLNTPLQTIRAIGANVAKNARNPSLTAPVRDGTSTYLLNNFPIGMMRVAINLKTWEPQNDNADPNVVRAAGFPDTGGINQNFRMIQEYTNKGVKVIASIFDLPDWMVSNPTAQTKRELKPGYESELAEAVSWWLKYLKQQYGVTIDTISINEGNGGYNARFNQLIFSNFLGVAGPYMEQQGLGYVKWLTGDDGVNTLNSHTKPLLENPNIRQYLGPVAYHSWSYRFISDSDLRQWYVQAQRYGKELWVTEFGTDAEKLNLATFATWDRAHDTALAYYRALVVTRANAILWWDFTEGFSPITPALLPNPSYYVVKPFHDNIPPGSVNLNVTPTDFGSVKALATKSVSGNRFFMQLYNDQSPGTSSQTVNLSGLPNTPLTVVSNREGDLGHVIGTFTPVGGRLSVSSPADSVVYISGKLTNTGTGSAPVATISSPAATLQYSAGSTLSFSGAATDADETLSSSKYHWTITPVRDGLFGTPQTFAGVKSGTFTIPPTNQRSVDQKYIVTLTVTDSSGLASTRTVEIRPRIINVTVKTNVAGVAPGLNGLWESLNTPVPMVAGTQNLFAPSPQFADGKIYRFSSWSIGGAATQSVNASADVTYTANYVQVNDGSAGAFLPDAGDAYVRDGDGADQNFGQAAELQNKNSGDAGKTRFSYIRFNISSLGTVNTAKLRLFGKLSGNGEIVATNLFGVDANWSEDAITYNNRPQISSDPLTTNTVADQLGRWYEWDVSAYVKAAKLAGATAVSFATVQAGNSSPYAGFSSGEAAAGQPQLYVSGSTIVDPTPSGGQISASADAYVRDGSSSGTNFGRSTDIVVKQGSGGTTRRGYLKFDISTLGSFTRVILRLRGRLTESVTGGVSTKVYAAAKSSWDENSITWSNQPGHTPTAIGSIRVRDKSLRSYEIDVTDHVRAQKTAGKTVVSFVLRNMASTTSQTIFASRETAADAARLVLS